MQSRTVASHRLYGGGGGVGGSGGRGVGSDLMTWKKGFYANDGLNLSPTLCRPTQTDAGTHAQTGTHRSL